MQENFQYKSKPTFFGKNAAKLMIFHGKTKPKLRSSFTLQRKYGIIILNTN